MCITRKTSWFIAPVLPGVRAFRTVPAACPLCCVPGHSFAKGAPGGVGGRWWLHPMEQPERTPSQVLHHPRALVTLVKEQERPVPLVTSRCAASLLRAQDTIAVGSRARACHPPRGPISAKPRPCPAQPHGPKPSAATRQ